MAYDEELAARIRDDLGGEPGVVERRMFGGLAFLVDGHMAVAASGQGGLMVRVDPDRGDALVDDESVRPFEMRGRSMTGWLHVTGTAIEADDELRTWVRRGVEHARSLPPK
jgi:TfoX/Sxy family transcriptional regulator of competence genes